MKTPIYHIGLIRRSKGTICSAVDAMAYILGKNWKSAYDGQSYDHEDKAGEVVYSRVLAPTDTPQFAFQPFVLAHAIEWCESKKNAQLMRHIYFSLPPELSRELQVALLNEYAQTFVDKGMVASVALHDAGLGNPNGHILLTMRALLPDGTFAPKSKHEPLVDGQGQKIKGKDGRCKRKKIPTTDWDYMGNGELWRRTWADITNTYYKMAGLDLAIDYRSLKRQGIIRIPTVYLNPTDHQAERRGERTEIGDLNRWICSENERREKEELRREAIHQLLEAFKEKYNGLAKRKQYLSPQTRATQQFWQDLHAIESQFSTGTPPPEPPKAGSSLRALPRENGSRKEKI